MSLTFRMYSTIRFNRPISKDTDYVCPGGYEMTMNGVDIQFDFEDYEGTIDKDDPCLLHVMQKNPDYSVFSDASKITEDHLNNVEKIIEFYVYTREPGESDLEPVSVESIVFVLPYDDWKNIHVDSNVIKESNIEFAC